MIGLTVLPSMTMERCQGEQLRDIIQYFGSDVVFTPDRVHEPFLTSQIGDAATVVTQPLASSSPRELARQPDVRLIWISSPADLDLERNVQNKRTGPAYGCTHLYLLSDCLSLSIDLVNLDARLDGLEAYRAPLDEHEMTDASTHLTIEANPAYRADWEGLDVQGVMPGVSEQQGISQAGVVHFDLQANGIIGAKTRPLKRFGLTAADQVGRARATTLRQAGIQSRTDLETASIHEISTLDRFGQTTARTAIESAQVIEQDEIRKAPGAELPSVSSSTSSGGSSGSRASRKGAS